MIGAAHWPQAGANVYNAKPLGEQPSQRRRRERPDHEGSRLLTRPENELMFDILGPDRISLAAGVVQLLRANQGHWQHESVGVCTLVKDYQRKLYVLNVFDIYNGSLLWEQILYRQFRAKGYAQCPKFVTFEGDTAVYGLNFSDEEEARNFKHHLDKRHEQEMKTNQKSTDSRAPLSDPRPAVTKPPAPGITDVGSVPHFGIYKQATNGNNKKIKANDKKNKKKPKIRKEDIGHPTNFQHKAHLGWDVDGGFSQRVCAGELDESVREVLRAAGRNPDDMNREELDFARTFISSYKEPPVPSSAPVPPLPPQQQQQQRQVNRVPEPVGYPHAMPSYQQQPVNMFHNHPQLQYQPYQPPQVLGHGPPPTPQRNESMQANSPIQLNQTYNPRPARTPPFQTHNLHQGYQSSPAPSVAPPPMPAVSQLQRQDSREAPRPQANPPPPPPPPPSSQPASAAAPPPPPPPPPPGLLLNNNSPKPPPPPPSQAAKPAPAAAGGRADLLQQIQAGKKLKHVDPPAERSPLGPSTGNNRDNMMQQIRQGANLKHVDQVEVENKRKSVPNTAQIGGIAGALARALEERRKNMNNSDDSDSGGENDSEWEDD